MHHKHICVNVFSITVIINIGTIIPILQIMKQPWRGKVTCAQLVAEAVLKHKQV